MAISWVERAKASIVRDMSIATRRPASDYDDDFYAWSKRQARLLRIMAAERVNTPLDLKHLAEEVEDLGREQLHAAESLTAGIIEHLLKLACSPASDPRRGWRRSLMAGRLEVARG